MSDLIKRSEVWQALHNIGGCGADPDSWADGWDKAIDAAIEAVEKLPAACSDEIIRCRNCKYCFIDLSGREAHICMQNSVVRKRVKLNDFCSFAKKKGRNVIYESNTL